MRVFIILLLVVFTFTSTASYAAICCVKAEKTLHDCHSKHKTEKESKKCEFDCGLNFSAKTLSSPITLSINEEVSEFKIAYEVGYHLISQEGQERPPKHSV